MEQSTTGRHFAGALDELAIACLSAALQFDYLSSGAHHRQSTAVLKTPRAPRRPARVAQPATTPAIADDAHETDESPWTEEASPTHTADATRRYLNEAMARPRLSSSEEYRLAAQARRGDKAAAHRLAEHNLGLVVMIARRYAGGPVALLDLIQEGNIGLMTACTRFDPEMGYRLSTYAKWWIRQAIEMALMNQSSTVRVPAHAARTLRREGDDAALAGHCLLVDASVAPVQDRSEDQEAVHIVDTLPAPLDDQPEEQVQQAKRRDRLKRALHQLSASERHVLEQRFGLRGEDPLTLQAIATPMGLSCERVRQIEGEAIAKLRALLAEEGLEPQALL
jgi:RNA polymerase nonessential primary-like sigma factor